MPIIKSAIKRVRQQTKRRSRNLAVKNAVKRDIRAVETAVTGANTKAMDTALREAFSEIDRAVKKGTLHKNTAARRKSQLSKLVTQNTKSEARSSKQTKNSKSKTV
jgi:small subunit ribosomal protein S20